jgi:tripartite-type tricarboxylate transporter receptor subunit TctC
MRQDRKTAPRRHFITLAAAAVVGLWAAPAAAQDDKWPSKPIRMIVPFPAGSFTDTVARVMSDSLARSLGQTVIVENKAGANGVLGLSEAARLPGDGYTLVVTNSSSITINPQIYKKVSYKASDFTPVTMMLEAPFVLVANPEWAQKNSIATVKDAVAYAQRNPGKLSYGSAGPGNIAHLSLAMLSNKANVKTTHIPYKSAAASQMATMSGEIDLIFDTWSALPQIKAGKLKPLAVTSAKRMLQLPEVPTVAEAGYPDVVVTFWIGMLAPAGTPPHIVQKIAALSQEVLKDDKAKAVLSASGDVVMSSPATFAKRIESEVPAWGAVIQREAISLD